MFGLTSTSLLIVCAALGILCLGGVAWLAWTGKPTRRGQRLAAVAALMALGQFFAVLSAGLVVNDDYAFYTSWADLFGEIAPTAAISAGSIVPPGEGRVQVYKVPAHGVRDSQVLVWFPPQYDQPAFAHHQFPVVMVLPGYPGRPSTTFIHLRFADQAMREISSGRVQPFIGVFPPITIAPPRDTECTNVPHGPQAETWIARTVPTFIEHHLRTRPTRRDWSVWGWSTGGFCVAKLLTHHRTEFSSGVAMGAYFEPLEDNTTGRLFGMRTKKADQASPLWNDNSPLWLYERHGIAPAQLLIITGRQDGESWRPSQAMIAAAHSDPAVSSISFPIGGHNFHDYGGYVGAALEWAARLWAP